VHEMTTEDHRDIAACLWRLRGMVIVSGYACDLYDELFAGWTRIDRKHLADGARPRVESLWFNRAAHVAQKQTSFLDHGGFAV
jgi:DNA adenine methylase